MAYRLKLLVEAKVYPIFHVSLLKRKIGQNCPSSPTLPQTDEHGQFLVEPLAVLDRLLFKRNNAAVVEVLVQWSNTLPTEATCTRDFLTSSLEDKVFLMGGL